MFQTEVVEKIKTYILCSINFFFPENRAVYGVKWKMSELDRSRIAIRRMRFACCVTNATDTHKEYVIVIGFPRQQWLRERASLLRSTDIACLVVNTFCLKMHKTSFAVIQRV